jgi:hypothetical protein
MTSAPTERNTTAPEPSTPRDVRSGFGDPSPASSSSAAPGELEDLLGRARATAETAALDAAIETELALDEDEEVIDDFAHPPLDDDPLLADELAAERVAEERASRGNGDH